MTQKPKEVTVCPGVIFAAHVSGVTVTDVPERTSAPDQDWLMVAVAGSWKRKVHQLIVVEPLFLIDVDRQ